MDLRSSVRSILILAALTSCIEGKAAEIGTTPPVIAVYTQFEVDPSAPSVEEMIGEMAAIMDPVGLQFVWRAFEGRVANEISSELVVATFKGRCHASEGLSRHPGNTKALGWTQTSDGELLPFSDVDCDRIWSFLRTRLMAFPAHQRDKVFGRAVARVLAHEIYHILAKTPRHGVCGIGKATFTVDELLSEEFRFEEHESTALRASRVQ